MKETPKGDEQKPPSHAYVEMEKIEKGNLFLTFLNFFASDDCKLSWKN